ncbi:30S ribosomal protein S16 [bacterium]|nr:30S ribosomal protein S16 [bacterium]
MLKIRLSRTGRKNYPSYRIVVAEHSAPIKGKFLEVLGHYIPNRDPKVLEYNEKKIREWISKGAKPSDTVASLLKHAGVSGMEDYIDQRNKKRKKKKEVEETPVATPTTSAPAEVAKEEKPAETTKENPVEPTKEEPKEEKLNEKPDEEPKKEES